MHKHKAHTQVTDTKWSGQTDSYDNAIAGAAYTYTYTFTVEIKLEYQHTFTTKTIKATVNDVSDGVKVERVSDKKAIVTYTFPALEEKADKDAEAELKCRWSQAEADANCPLSDPITLVINEDKVTL